MDFDKQKIGDKNFIVHAPKGSVLGSVDDVLSSWTANRFSFPESKSEGEVGFRSAQLGAVFAIKSHWTVTASAATVVMPTGQEKLRL
jgi:hypothetical protein